MIRRHFVDTRFGQMHVLASTGSGRPLVTLHMTPLSSRMWLPLMSRLARPVIAPDRLGFGCSDSPPHDLDIEDYARSTLDALDAMEVGRFDLLGEHTGSVEAVALTHLVPGRVGAVGLVAIPAYTEAELEERQLTRAASAMGPQEDGSHFQALWNRRLSYRRPPYDLDLLHRNTVDELRSAGAHRAYRAVFAYPMLKQLQELDRPVVVFAPRDDLAIQTERARPHLPAGSVYVELHDLTLDIFEVAADRMAALVEDHLGDDRG